MLQTPANGKAYTDAVSSGARTDLYPLQLVGIGSNPQYAGVPHTDAVMEIGSKA